MPSGQPRLTIIREATCCRRDILYSAQRAKLAVHPLQFSLEGPPANSPRTRPLDGPICWLAEAVCNAVLVSLERKP